MNNIVSNGENVEAIAQQCETAGLVGAANTMRLLLQESTSLKQGEEWVRNLLVGMYADCIIGLSDAAIIKQQEFNASHVAAAVKQLSESAAKWRKCVDGTKEFVKSLREKAIKALDKETNVREAYTLCLMKLQELINGL